jgi:subtilisin family serine protease
VILKLALGEAPEHVPTGADVRRGAATAASGLDGGGPIDRLLQSVAGDARITRLHAALRGRGHVGQQHHGYDDIEHATGLSRTFRVQLAQSAPVEHLVDALRQVRHVETAGLNWVTATPFAAGLAEVDADQAWSTRALIGAAEAMAYEPGDTAIIVALVDSGVAPDHPELSGRLRAGFDCVHLGPEDLAAGMRYLGKTDVTDTAPYDYYVGHGTSCAGIIGALGEVIPPGLSGACPLLPVRVLGAAALPGRPDPLGIGAIADIDVGLKIAVDLGARVVNCSFGTPDALLDPHTPKPHQDVVRYAAARGAVLVAASGNSGREEVFWPAAFPEVIAVGSVSAEGIPSAFATTGTHVALAAPGEQVVSCGLQGYQLATGTSFAAPFATAAAALLLSRAARRSCPLDYHGVRALLARTATPFASPETGRGSGVLDVATALRALDQEIDTAPPGEGLAGELDLAA